MVTRADVQAWSDGLDGVVDRIAPRFGRTEPRRRAGAYLRGLLAPVERKNGWQLAEAVGDRTPDGVPDFLSRVQWDADAVRDDLQAYVIQHLAIPMAWPCWMKPVSSKRAASQPGCSGNTAAPPVGSRTARSACSSAMRAVMARC